MTNSFQLLLLDLLEMGESPLYSAYGWLGEQLGHAVPMSEFLYIVEDMLSHDFVRLWAVEGHDRSELYELPPGLDQRYARVGHGDKRFDPFGLSLTVSPDADLKAPPDWKVDIEFDRGEFVLETKRGADQQALSQLARCFPQVRFVLVEATEEDDGLRISGLLIPTAKGE